MPTYDYLCQACQHRFERVQPMTADPIRECPECGEEHVTKVFGVPGISFRGSGFYKNDSRAGSGKGGSGKSAKEGTSSGEGSSDGSGGGKDTSTAGKDAGGGGSSTDKAAASSGSGKAGSSSSEKAAS